MCSCVCQIVYTNIYVYFVNAQGVDTTIEVTTMSQVAILPLYAYIYIYMYMFEYMYICTYICVYVYIGAYVNFLYIYIYYTHVYIYIYMFILVRMSSFGMLHDSYQSRDNVTDSNSLSLCIHLYIYLHICTHLYICMCIYWCVCQFLRYARLFSKLRPSPR